MNLSLVKEEKGQATAAVEKEVLTPPSPPVARHPPPPNAEPKQAASQTAGRLPSSTQTFVPPTLSAVSAYMQEQKALCQDPHQAKEQAQRFVNYYQSNGWKVGRNPMQDWQAAANNWLLNAKDYCNQAERNHKNDIMSPNFDPYAPRLHSGGSKDFSIPL